MSSVHSTEPTMARLSFRVAAEQIAEFETAYQAKLVPILKQHDLVESPEPGRQTVEDVFRRLFEVESPKVAIAAEHALQKDPRWQQALQELSARFANADPTLNDRFRLYSAPAGPGRTTAVGSGSHRGPWQSFGIQDGFPVAITFDILQDRAGNLWFATTQGVCRFDGAWCTTFTAADGLAGDSVRSLAEDDDGDLWFSGRNGVSRYDGATFHIFTAEDGLADDYTSDDFVSCMLVDRQGRLWVGTHYGVSRYDGERFQQFTADGLPEGQVYAMLEDRQGFLWFGTNSGATRFDGERCETFAREEDLSAYRVNSILEDREGSLWFGILSFGINDGVHQFDGEKLVAFAAKEDPPWENMHAMLEDHEGFLWFASFKGATRFDREHFETFTPEDGLANYQVVSMLEDREGFLWFGTYTGISRYDPTRFATFTLEDGLPSNGVMSLVEDRQGDLWVGTWEGVCCYDGRRFVPVEDVAKCGIWSLLEDRQGDLWFGTYGDGVFRYDGQRIEHLLQRMGVITLAEDQQGRLWIGGEFCRGLYCYDGRELAVFTTADGLASDIVQAILEDRTGRLWVGTTRGLCRYDGQRFTTVTAADGRAISVNAFLEDRQGRLWVGSRDGGAYFYENGEFIQLSTPGGLGNNYVMSIIEDREGHLWFGTYGGGVCRYDGRLFHTLSKADGLAHDGVHQIIQGRSGDFWIATEGGLTRYRPSRTPPHVQIVEITADRRYGAPAEIRLPASQKLLTFAFQGRSFTTSPDRLAYVCRLEGHDTDWQPVYTRRITYEELPLGEYTFQVRAVDRDFNYSEPATVRVVVEPDPHLQALTQALSAVGPADRFVGESQPLSQIQEQLAQVAATDVTVLILGETGTGKGLAARTLHALSPRHTGPLIQVNCGAIPAGLVESELFGHEKGAFTGAVSRKLGRVELAQEGTLFLDEIGDMSQEAQTRLLQLLEDGTFERVGGTRTMTADVRVVAATNRNLPQMVEEGTFRQDLYYRLQGFEVRLPPLRERQEDIPMLSAYFAERMAAHLHKTISRLEPAALELLRLHSWPGNVRELEHAVQRAVIVCSDEVIRAEDLPLDGAAAAPAEEDTRELVPLEEHERRYIRAVLERANWVVSGPQGAAAILGLPESSLRFRMKKLSISRS